MKKNKLFHSLDKTTANVDKFCYASYTLKPWFQ